MVTTITKYIASLGMVLVILINAFGNYIGTGDIIETKPPTTSTTEPEWDAEYASYRYDSKNEYYYMDDKECWQKDLSYEQVYGDIAPAAGMFIDQVRVRFNYEGKDWLIQMWKGQYGFLLVGSEISIFTAPDGTYDGVSKDISPYRCPDKEDWLNIQHNTYFDSEFTGEYEKIFTKPYGKYWWANGYIKDNLTKYTIPKTELKTSSRITFKSEEMATLFIKGLEAAGFVKADSVNSLINDSFYQNGSDVWINWLTVHNDVNVGNGTGEPVIIEYN